jgi:hypothetical protein
MEDRFLFGTTLLRVRVCGAMTRRPLGGGAVSVGAPAVDVVREWSAG